VRLSSEILRRWLQPASQSRSFGKRMYSLSGYGRMVVDRVRMEAYTRALRQTVTPDSVVLDIGTGTGIFALLACRFGARRVYALEPSDIIKVARETALVNGMAQRIEFIQGLSTDVTLPERADVVVSDLRGILPLKQHHIPAILDVRERLLVPQGVLIPQRDSLWAAVAEAPEVSSQCVSPWEDRPCGLDLSAARRIAVNTWSKVRLQPEQLLVTPQCWATLDYTTVTSPHISATLVWTMLRAGTMHGLVVWFDTVLIEGVAFSNAPSAPEAIYGSAFFPLEIPVTVSAGDTASVSLHAYLIGEDYVWRWDTCVFDQGHPEQVKASLRQSNLFDRPLAAEDRRKLADRHRPMLQPEGEIDRFILNLMDGQTSLGEIAAHLMQAYPAHFTSLPDALTRAGKLSHKYSR